MSFENADFRITNEKPICFSVLCSSKIKLTNVAFVLNYNISVPGNEYIIQFQYSNKIKVLLFE